MDWNKMMAAEYRESAEKLTRRAEELRAAADTASLSEAMALRDRAIGLEQVAMEIARTASKLETYYD